LELGPRDLAVQHTELVALDGDLDILGVLALEASKQHADKPACHEVEEGQGHWPILPRPGPRRSTHTAEVSEPHGLLQPGDQLPTAKQVVAQLAINPNTVLKAYRQLEQEGLVAGRPGLGTFVTRSLASTPPASHAALRRRLAAWLTSARQAGLDDDSILALFQTTFRASAAASATAAAAASASASQDLTSEDIA